jgi:hypothetical protein
MAILRRREIGEQTYLYVVQNRRRGGKVEQVILEYLGNAPDVTAARLAAAIKYWKVGQAKRTRKGGR